MLILAFINKDKVSGALQKRSNYVVKLRHFKAIMPDIYTTGIMYIPEPESVLDTAYKPPVVYLNEIHMSICRNNFRLIRTPVHLHPLLHIDLHVNDII